MNYWWVNHKQTHKAEIEDGYIWCPYRNSKGYKRPTYETLRGVKPGDVILSFYNKAVRHYGVVKTYKYSFPKPKGFDKNWGEWGWRCDVRFYNLDKPVFTQAKIGALRQHLRKKHNPIQAGTGAGNQPCYLAKITEGMIKEIARLSGSDGLQQAIKLSLCRSSSLDNIQYKYNMLDDIQISMIELRGNSDANKELLQARYGIGVYREKVAALEKACRITAAACHPALSACHIKPWREADDKEKLEGTNGLLLSPGTAQMFSYGFFSFSHDGEVIKSSLLEEGSPLAGNIPSNAKLKKKFNGAQQDFLEHHRNYVLLEAAE